MTTAMLDRPDTTTLPAWGIDAVAFRALVDAVAPAARKGFLGVPMFRLTTTDDGLLTASADDLNHGIDAWCETDVTVPGEVIVSWDVLHALLDRIDGLVNCEATKKGLDVRVAGTNAIVRTIEPGMFRYPAVEPSTAFSADLDATAFARAIDRCAQAAARDGFDRPVLEGVHFDVRDGQLLAYAFDGYRAALARIGGAPADWPEGGYTVPAPALKSLHKLLVRLQDGETVRVAPTITNGRLVVFGPSWRVSGGLLSGIFPDVPRHIAETWTAEGTTALVATKNLDRAISLAMAFTPALLNDDKKTRCITLHLKDGSLVVAATGLDQGEVQREVAAVIHGPDNSVRLDARYLREALAVCPETVELRVAAGDRTAFLIADPAGPDRFAISPMVGRSIS